MTRASRLAADDSCPCGRLGRKVLSPPDGVAPPIRRSITASRLNRPEPRGTTTSASTASAKFSW